MEALASRWGCSAPNRLADRAGRYRRLAVAAALLPAPLLAMGVASAAGRGSSPGYTGAHLALAGACAWLAADLFRRASVLDRRAWPVASGVAVLTCLVLLARLRPPGFSVPLGSPAVVTPALVALFVAFVGLVLAERLADRFLALVGRWALVGGGALLGAVELSQALAALIGSPADAGAQAYAAGLGVAALLLVLTAYFEARILFRGLALFRMADRR
jgi:hypothetical protein